MYLQGGDVRVIHLKQQLVVNLQHKPHLIRLFLHLNQLSAYRSRREGGR